MKLVTITANRVIYVSFSFFATNTFPLMKEVICMRDFENGKVGDIYYSRFIASFIKMKNKVEGGYDIDNRFEEWLRTLIIDGKPISEEAISDMMFMMENGKLELEISAKEYLKKNP